MARRLVPPTGFYDPALDAQQRAAQSGYLDFQQDTELAGSRAAQDYGFGLEDLTTQRERGYGDLNAQFARGQEDHDRSVQDLLRSYQQLGRRQAEGARTSGVLSGGLALKAAAARKSNEALDQRGIDTSWQRQQDDIKEQRARLGQDFATQSGRLAVDFGRGGTDRGTALSRAGRENTQFGLDIDEQRLYQAGQAGWQPPPQGGGGGGGFGASYHPQGVGAGVGPAMGSFGRGAPMNIQDLLRRLRGG